MEPRDHPPEPGRLVRWVPIASWLPGVSWPHLKLGNLWVLLPSAAGMMLVIFSEALGAGQAFADKHGYRLESSQEMIALGLATSARACSAGWPRRC